MAEAERGFRNLALARGTLQTAEQQWMESGFAVGGQFKPSVLGFCARYLFQSERSDGSPNDPVARFDLENGASLERVNWLRDVSARGIGQGARLMINYHYDLSRLEQNHELYVANKKVITSHSVKALFKETSVSNQSLHFLVSEEFHE